MSVLPSDCVMANKGKVTATAPARLQSIFYYNLFVSSFNVQTHMVLSKEELA